MIILFVLLLVILLFFSYKLDNKTINFFIRLVIIALVVLLIFKVKVSYGKNKVKPKIYMLLDTSLSMSITDKYLRMEKALETAKKIKMSLPDYDFETYYFADILKNQDKLDLANFEYRNGTAIIKAINLLNQDKQKSGKNIDSIILISDGQDNSGIPLTNLRKDLPVHIVGIGEDNYLKDIAIVNIDYPKTIYSKLPFKVNVNYIAFNNLGNEFNLIVKKDDLQIMSKKIIIEKENENVTETLTIIPDFIGEQKYSVVLSADKLIDKNPNNNKVDFLINSIKDSFKILYISGSPGWEYSFLRNLIKEDLKYELVSFVILRRPENIVMVPDKDLSLIPFPIDVFRNDVYNYDLLVLENFDFRKYIPYENFENVKKYIVDTGGSVLFIGGENAFSKAGYANTALSTILPVEFYSTENLLLKNKNGSPGLNSFDFIKKEVKFQPVNLYHPVIALGTNPVQTKNIWDSMPSLFGYNEFENVKNKSGILGEADGKPVFVLEKSGKGKIAVLGVNTTWRWSFNKNLVTQNYYYSKFWKNLIKYLINAQDFSRINIKTSQDNFIIKKQIDFFINFLNSNYIPFNPAIKDLKIIMKAPSGKITDLTNIIKIKNKDAILSFIPDEEGFYNFEISLNQQDVVEKKDYKFVVQKNKTEDLYPKTNFDLLKNIAQITGGYYFDDKTEDFTGIRDFEIKQKKGNSFENYTKKTIDFSENYIILIVLILIFTMDLFIRKTKGKI